jgi:hypothetical protein
VQCGRCVGLTTCRHLWTDCLDNVWSLTYHNPIGLQCLLRGSFTLFFYNVAETTRLRVICMSELVQRQKEIQIAFPSTRFSSLVQGLIHLKNIVTWEVMPCSSLKANRRFGGTNYLRHQARVDRIHDLLCITASCATHPHTFPLYFS